MAVSAYRGQEELAATAEARNMALEARLEAALMQKHQAALASPSMQPLQLQQQHKLARHSASGDECSPGR